MNLVVDIGNTRVKLGIFDRSKMLFDQTVHRDELAVAIKALFERYPQIEHGFLARVGEEDKRLEKVLSLFCSFQQLTPETRLPFVNDYDTPETLGVDRIALVAGAHHLYPNQNVLVIDAGTAITYDLITDRAHYLGGTIAPGLQMRYRALNDYTASLPLLEPESFAGLLGQNTQDSIHSGVSYAAVCEMDGMIEAYRARFPHLTVILTGGDAQFFGKRLKNSIFAHSKILLEGLNFLLEYNK